MSTKVKLSNMYGQSTTTHRDEMLEDNAQHFKCARAIWANKLETDVGKERDVVTNVLMALFQHCALKLYEEDVPSVMPTYRKLLAKPTNFHLTHALSLNVLPNDNDTPVTVMRRSVTNLPEEVLNGTYVYDAAYSIGIRELRNEVLIELHEMEKALY